MLWVSRHVVLNELPAGPGEASLCPEHPGFPEDVYVTSTPAELYRLVVGKQSLKQAMDEGAVRVEGPPRLIRTLPRWFLLRASGPPVIGMSSSR
jgi:hypothetical protein